MEDTSIFWMLAGATFAGVLSAVVFNKWQQRAKAQPDEARHPGTKQADITK